MNDVLNQIEQHKLVPVVAIDNADDAEPLGDALVAGGLPVAEITFRTEAAEAAIHKLAKRDDMLVGAGTVLNEDQLKRAVNAGAKFIVSPGTSLKVVEYCAVRDILITPGVATPTEVELAMSYGFTTLKFFPAEAMGGIKTLKAISAPYGMVRFIPTGGIGPTNLTDYLALKPVIACGGSWMVKSDMISEHQFDRITELTQQAVSLAGSA